MSKVQRTGYFLAPIVVLAAALALTIKPLAQDTVQSDPPDSGYVSAYLANLDRASAGENENGRARLESMRESRGTIKGFASYVLQQANLQRQLFANSVQRRASMAG